MSVVQNFDPSLLVFANGVKNYAFVILDSNGMVASWNPGAERIKGYRQDEILGRHFSCFYPQDKIDKDEPGQHLEQASAFGSVVYQGWRMRKDGTSFWANVLITAMRDERNHLTGFVKITQDFTDHKRIEALAAIVELSHDAIIATKIDGTVFSWNRGAQTLYGYSASEMCGKSINLVFVPTQSLPVLEELAESSNFEGVHITKTGTTLTTSVTVSPMKDSDGHVTEVSWICRDITNEKRLRDELERSNMDLQQFAYVASHDLQEPVRAVIGSLQIVEESIGATLDERATKFLNEAKNGATRMQVLINDLLSYAQVHTKAADLLPTDLSVVYSEAIENLQSAIEDTGTTITCDPLPVVEANRSQMRRVFQNLIENAIKYRSATTPKIHVSATRNLTEWVFCITDNGIGLDMQYADRIFDIFQRLHSRSKYQGTGIGLAICKRIIGRHGGRVWVDSQPGRGSKFYFSLATKFNGGAQ